MGRGATSVNAPNSQDSLVRKGIPAIASRGRLEPLSQGSLDGLCGLYAVINSLRLALSKDAPLTRAVCEALFGAGIAYLHRRKTLHTEIIDGVEPRRRNALAQHLAKLVSTSNYQVTIERPESVGWRSIEHDVFPWMEQSLLAGKPVLITLTGGLEHHSVVSGMTSRTLKLFDSSAHRSIRKASCGLRSGFYQLPLNGICRVALQRPD